MRKAATQGAPPVPVALRIQYHAGRLGPTGIAGLAALLGALVLFAVTEGSWRPQLAADRADLSVVREEVRKARLSAPAAQTDGPAQFAAQLPAPAAMPALVEALHDDASKRNLRIDRGDYRVAREMGGLAQRHQVSLPVGGDYARLQAWLHQALLRHPSLALDELSVRRASDTDAQVQAWVQFSLYTRSLP